MITINEIKIDDVKYLNGKIGKNSYSVEYSDELKEALLAKSVQLEACTIYVEASKILEETLELIQDIKNVDSSSLVEVLKDDLYKDKKSGEYFIRYKDKVSKEPVHQFIVDKMIEANDKGLSPKPWLIFWVRLMRNKMYTKDYHKIDSIIDYISSKYVDEKNIESLEEEGYSYEMSKKLSTFDQISITEQGILAAFKYVRLIDHKYSVITNEGGEQEIVKTDKYEKTLEVDEITGKVTKDEYKLPDVAEDFVFEPPIMGQGGDPFTCRNINESIEEAVSAHIVQVGRIHELPNGFASVNCNDNTWGVKGLHLGGYYYVQGFGGATSYLVDCLVAPEDIGAVADISRTEQEGAIRCKRYMVTGAHFAVSKGMYHPSNYAKMLDNEWIEAKKEAISNINKQITEVEESV